MFDPLIVLYLFLGGFGGGLCLLLSVMGLSVPRAQRGRDALAEYARFFQSGYTLAFAVLAVASFCLLADAGGSSAVLYVFFAGRLTYLTVGAWSLVAAMLGCACLTVLWASGASKHPKLLKAVQIALVAVGFAVMLYTGLFLSAMFAVPLWHTAWLPALFVLSSLSCALASAPLIAHVSGSHDRFRGYFRRLAACDAVALVLEAACMVALLVAALAGGEGDAASAAAAASATDLLAGALAPVFWAGFAVVGLAVPLAFDATMARGRLSRSGVLYLIPSTFACVLLGAFCMRYCLVMAGAHPVATLLGA